MPYSTTPPAHPPLDADSNSPARQQLYDLCHGMRLVRLSADTPAQVGWAVAPCYHVVAAWGDTMTSLHEQARSA